MTASAPPAARTWVDGGLSTALERLGVSLRHELWTAWALVHAPQMVVEAHRRFLDAGAQLILTSSYQAGITNLTRSLGDEAEARRVVASSVDLARRAVELADRPDARVGASLGAYGALLADRSEYHGRYPVPWSEVAREQRSRAEVLLGAGASLLVCETLPTVAEASVTLAVLDELMPRHPGVEVWVTFTARAGGLTAGGASLFEVRPLLEGRSWVTAMGVNCTAPQHVPAALEALAELGVPLIAKPNRLPRADELARWLEQGVRYVGGCCGVGPEELASVISATS